MSISTTYQLTIDEFKYLYIRDFSNYSPYSLWSNATNYDIGKEIYLDTNYKVYKALIANININPIGNPTTWEEQTAIDLKEYITDTDIQRAFDYANIMCKSGFSNDIMKMLFYLLVAHYLELNINRVQESGSNGSLLEAPDSEGADGVSRSGGKNTGDQSSFNFLLRQTRFGQQYLNIVERKNTTSLISVVHRLY